MLNSDQYMVIAATAPILILALVAERAALMSFGSGNTTKRRRVYTAALRALALLMVLAFVGLGVDLPVVADGLVLVVALFAGAFSLASLELLLEPHDKRNP